VPSDELLRYIASSPAHDGLARMAVAIGGRRAKVVRLRRLRGGVDSSTHAVELDPGGWVVLKRMWLQDAREAGEEFERLTYARRLPVPTPEPLALDSGGEWFGRPALAMSRLPGRTRWFDDPGDTWIDQLAETLSAIHATPVPAEVPGPLLTPHGWQQWRPPPPTLLRRTARVEAVLGAAVALQQDLQAHPPSRVLTHHDFHFRNIGWTRGRLTAVVDWTDARLGPAVSDVAYCSVDLAMAHGLRAADRFVIRYAQAGAGRFEDLARWQLFWSAVALQWLRYWELSFSQVGPHLHRSVLRRRLAALADRLLDGPV
jgi:aminoglycoside phosphotransferase (APT) family kinase protein